MTCLLLATVVVAHPWSGCRSRTGLAEASLPGILYAVPDSKPDGPIEYEHGNWPDDEVRLLPTVLTREVLPEHLAAVAALTSGDLSLTTGLHIPVDGVSLLAIWLSVGGES